MQSKKKVAAKIAGGVTATIILVTSGASQASAATQPVSAAVPSGVVQAAQTGFIPKIGAFFFKNGYCDIPILCRLPPR